MHKIEMIDIEWRNFLSYGKIPQKITFTPGINLILGMDSERNRSNSSGKCVDGETNIDVIVPENIINIFLESE